MQKLRTGNPDNWELINDEIEIAKHRHSLGFDIHFKDSKYRDSFGFAYQIANGDILFLYDGAFYAVEYHLDANGELMYMFYRRKK